MYAEHEPDPDYTISTDILERLVQFCAPITRLSDCRNFWRRGAARTHFRRTRC